MSKQTSNKQPSPAELIGQAESTIAALEAKREQLVQRVADHASARERLAFQAHAMQDVEAGKELADAREQALRAEQELTEIDSALATANHRLRQAQAVMAREQRRAQIKEQQNLSQEYRKIGPFLDRATDHLRGGLQALAKNAAAVGKDVRYVQTLHRVLQVAFFDTVFRDVVGVPGHDERRNFSTFSGVVNSWCDSCDASLAPELCVARRRARQANGGGIKCSTGPITRRQRSATQKSLGVAVTTRCASVLQLKDVRVRTCRNSTRHCAKSANTASAR